MTSENDREYEIGYGRPPKHTQFRPGQSGNPRGRPKGRRSLKEDFDEEMSRRVRITENGESRTLYMQQIIMRSLVTDAAKGKSQAIKLVIAFGNLFSAAEDSEAVEIGDLSEEDRKIIEDMLRRNSDVEGDDDAG